MSTILKGYTLFDKESILQYSNLDIDISYSKGHEKNVFLIDITDKDFNDFDEQVTDTINYLDKNFSNLKNIKNNLSDLRWEIDFGYTSKTTTGELALEGLFFPLKLIQLCAELQIELLVSLYDGDVFE